MIQTTQLLPGVTLHCYRDTRFKQGCLTFQFLRSMEKKEAALNALLPDVLLRGTRVHPNIRSINQHMDANYGVGLGALARQTGDYQATGIAFSFLDDRFALAGESVLAGVLDFLEEVLTQPLVENDGFLPDVLESEKRNLIATIESELNNKGAYAMGRLIRSMGREDAFGMARLGEKADVAAISADGLYRHFLRLRREARIEIFYVGSGDMDALAHRIRELVGKWERDYRKLPDQTHLTPVEPEHLTEVMDVAQGKLCMGFVTPVDDWDDRCAAMNLFNVIFGAGMTSKLFRNVREKLSLCYSVGSGFYTDKGVMTVSAGIDFDKEDQTRQEILHQLKLCQEGQITEEELQAAKAAICSGLRNILDTPSLIERYYSATIFSASTLSMEQYREVVENTTLDQVVEVANTLRYHSSYFLKGEEA